MSFITDRGTSCYKAMPFGLKNVGATYQRLINKIFQRQIRRNMEVYVDDMLVKSKKASSHLEDLKETFRILKKYKMELNPAKCRFGVSSRKFLGFLVSQRGVEANPDKIRAIIDMKPPRTVREIQSLTRRVTALNKFVSKATDKCLPFFRVLEKAFVWTLECDEAFAAFKQYLVSPPFLSPPKLDEPLYLYLEVSETIVSGALVREEDKVQHPIYFVSKALRRAEERYPWIKKVALTLVTSVRKLRHYF